LIAHAWETPTAMFFLGAWSARWASLAKAGRIEIETSQIASIHRTPATAM
jgi:hypothetical protein